MKSNLQIQDFLSPHVISVLIIVNDICVNSDLNKITYRD